MLFTWSTKNLCIVFHTWRITGPLSLLLSLLAIILLTAGYEGIREVTRQYEASHSRQLKAYSSPVNVGMFVRLWFCFVPFSSFGSYLPLPPRRALSVCLSVHIPYGGVAEIIGHICTLKEDDETTIAGDPSIGQGGAPPTTTPEFNDPHHRNNTNESSSLLLIVGKDSKLAFERRGRIVMAILYAIQVFYSFFIM